MTIWIILGVLALAGLCYGSYRFGQRKPKSDSIRQPWDFARPPQVPRPPAPRLSKPIHHEPIQSPPVVVTHRIGQGVTAGYYKSLTDPEAEIITAVYYDGSHRDKNIPAGYVVDVAKKQTFYSREEFLRNYAPAEVGIVMTPEDIKPESKGGWAMAHRVPAEPIVSTSELEDQMFQKAAAELGFPTKPRTYSGPCEHSIAREQLRGSKYQGMGHFIPCRECGQQFEFVSDPEHPSLGLGIG